MESSESRPFGELLAAPLRNGLTRPKAVRGSGTKMVNMGELFAHPRIKNAPMDRVLLSGAEREKSLLATGDLLFARQSLVLEGAGKCSIFVSDVEPVTFESHIIRARLNRDIADPDYFFYYFTSSAGRASIRSIVEQVAAAGIRGRDLAQLRVPVPPMSKQCAIARALRMLDDKIAINQGIRDTLEMTARAIFASWFVDFDSVHRTMEGEQVGLPAEVAAFFPPMLTVIKGREVPDGWQLEPVGRHMEVVRGLSYHGAGLSERGLPMHNLNSVLEGGGYKYEGIKFYTGGYQDRHVVHRGDVLVANTEQGHRRRLIGFPAIVPGVFGEAGIFSHHLFRVRPVDGSPLSSEYLYHWLVSNQAHQEVSGYATGTTVNMLPPDALALPLIVVPPAQLVRTFDGLAARARQRCEQLQSESETLADIRELLLSELLGRSSKRADDLVCRTLEEASNEA